MNPIVAQLINGILPGGGGGVVGNGGVIAGPGLATGPGSADAGAYWTPDRMAGAGVQDMGIGGGAQPLHPHPEVDALMRQVSSGLQGLAAHPAYGPVGQVGPNGPIISSPGISTSPGLGGVARGGFGGVARGGYHGIRRGFGGFGGPIGQ